MSDERSAENIRFQQIASDLARDNQDALTAILRELGPSLVHRLRQKFSSALSEEDFEDVLSQTLLRIWVRRKRYSPEKAPFAVWCFFIAKNVAVDLIRQKARHHIALPVLWAELGLGSESGNDQSTHPALGDLQRLLKTISPLDRRLLFTSLDREGAWASELAKELQVPANVLRQRRFRALAKLRREMAQLGYVIEGDHYESDTGTSAG